eukprot:TRINITY_DN8131_c0_g1_i10.p2 TRINITY_DN8131_c0_g1~~TRINITY_DN8131_c0_g1_i10.p2  ORF type:complete len:107 (-),score=16.04 TRINITY_DN8131_c0_g1_i10:822-1142(-)
MNYDKGDSVGFLRQFVSQNFITQLPQNMPSRSTEESKPLQRNVKCDINLKVNQTNERSITPVKELKDKNTNSHINTIEEEDEAKSSECDKPATTYITAQVYPSRNL